VALGLTIEELVPAVGFLGPHVATRQIAFLGAPEHKRRYLEAMLAAELIGCVAITEPHVGSDAGSIGMTAERRGARYLLTGTKAWLAFVGGRSRHGARVHGSRQGLARAFCG
jgi:alkylation response protein AidB-like acyl-CoA dehydrogenase